jgi:hypothetical protein
VHDLLIPYAVLKAPPLQGVELKTTQTMLHVHTVALTQKDLITVNQGGVVTAKGGSHLFVIVLAKRRDQIQTRSENQSQSESRLSEAENL